MKTLKLYGLFAILILSVTFITWILGVLQLEEALEVLKRAGSVIGVLFLTTLIIQGIIKPKSPPKSDQQK